MSHKAVSNATETVVGKSEDAKEVKGLGPSGFSSNSVRLWLDRIDQLRRVA